MEGQANQANPDQPERAPSREYVIPDELRKRLDNTFTYHTPKDDQPGRYLDIREMAKQLAFFIAAKTPPSREQSVALTKLEESIFWANAAIARNE